MEPHQERVVQEREQLVDRINKLNAFLHSETFAKLDEAERERLSEQSVYMEQYAGVLGRRIEAFK